MDSFELNKILGAILGTLLFVMGLGFIAEAIYAPRESGPGYELPAPSEDNNNNGPTETKPAVDIGTLLASADPKAGESAAKKCQACHDFTEGGPNKTGPNLYDVVGRQIASHPGFSYSADLSAHSNEKWTYELLNTWLTAPKAFAAGTKMSYGGDKDDQDRANIIAYLGTLSHNPVPYPAPAQPAGAETPTSGEVVSGTASTGASEGIEGQQTASETTPAEASSAEAPAAASSAEAPAAASSAAASSAAVPASPAASAPSSSSP